MRVLNAAGGCNTLYGHVVNEIKRLWTVLRHCSYQHVDWDGNKLAHCLGKRAISTTNINDWVGNLDRCVPIQFVLICLLSLIKLCLHSSQKKKFWIIASCLLC